LLLSDDLGIFLSMVIDNSFHFTIWVLHTVHTSAMVKDSLSYYHTWVFIYSTTVIDISSNNLISP
jgi:hypothetical protein